jgi:hypothetical protein
LSQIKGNYVILVIIKFVISVRGHHCNYLPQVLKNLAMPLAVDGFYMPLAIEFLFGGKFIITKASNIFN